MKGFECTRTSETTVSEQRVCVVGSVASRSSIYERRTAVEGAEWTAVPLRQLSYAGNNMMSTSNCERLLEKATAEGDPVNSSQVVAIPPVASKISQVLVRPEITLQ
jgi:hypothetical protein